MKSIEILTAIAAQNHGVITSVEIMSVGVSEHQIRSLVALGVLVRVTRGIYGLAGAPDTWHQRLAIACVRLGPDSTVSHRSAAGLWMFDRYRSGAVEISGPWPATRSIVPGSLPFSVVQRVSRDLDEVDRTKLHGLPVTTPTRSLIDMAACVGSARLGSMIDDAVRRGLTSFEEIADRSEALCRRGRKGAANLHETLMTRQIGVPVLDSELEAQVRRLIRRAGLPEPEPQHPVVCGENTFHIDLAWPELLVGIECDGFRFHRLPSDLESDSRRANELSLRGWLLHRVTSRMVRYEPDRLAVDIGRTLAARRRSLHESEPTSDSGA